jgi:hypothetical protein
MKNDLIQEARLQDLLYLTINPADKDSKKNVIAEINIFFGLGGVEAVAVR